MDRAHDIQGLSFSGALMRLRADGKDYEINLGALSQRLANASQEQRDNVEVSPAGYGLHWPDLDEDLSIDGLIGVKHPSPLTVPSQKFGDVSF